MIDVVSPGLLTTIQDSGRSRYENYGVPRSGFFDPFLARICNRLVGNRRESALLEFAVVGPALRFRRDTWIALTGFSVRYHCNGVELPSFAAVRISAGSVLEFQDMKGWFGYMAVGGGLNAPQVLGSSSTYLAGGIGKRLEKGDQLQPGRITGPCYRLDPARLQLNEKGSIPILPALHTSAFAGIEQSKLALREFYVTPQSNRMGIRFEGVEVQSPTAGRSVPTWAGIIQVPSSGKPILLGPDGPTTGGYPQIAVMTASGWTTLAGIRPGASVRFHWIDRGTARGLRRSRERIFLNRFLWKEVK